MTTKTFISNNSSYTVYDNNLTIFGRSGGTEIVRIRAGVTGLKLDANIERIDLSETLASYQFVFVAGMGLQIQKDGSVIATLASINQNVKMAFYDGAATLVQTGRSAFTLGGSAVSTETAGVLSPTLTTEAGDYSTFRLIVTAATGDSAAINAAFGTYEGTTATVTADGMNPSQITAVTSNAGKIAAGGITGTISLSNVQFGTLSTALNASATITVTDTNLAATALTAMDTKSTPLVNASLVTTVTGTASEIAAFATAAGITRAANFAATMSDAATLAQLATIDGANGSGALNYTAVTGIAADFAAADGTTTAHNTTYVTSGKNVTVTDAATLAQLATIRAANGAGTLTYTAVTDLAATLATNAGGYVTGAINVTVTDVGSVAATLLSAIGGATTGTVTAATVSTVTGSATEVTAALVTALTKVTTAANPHIILSDSDSVAATVLSAIGGLTTGNVTAPNVTTVTGLTSEVTAALITAETMVIASANPTITPLNPTITLTDSGSIAATVLSSIGAITTGSVTGSNITTVTGSASQLMAALVTEDTKVTVAGNAAVTISNAPDVAQLKAINNATTGAIMLNVTSGALSGSAADLFAALAGITNYTGNITITTQPTVAELKAINDATSGTITLDVTGGALSGVSADLFAALNGIRTYTGTVTITDAATVAQLTEINAATSGLITAVSTTLTGTAAAIKVVTDAIGSSISLGTMTGGVSNVPVTVSNAPTVEELKSINNATSGAITLNVTSGDLSGSTVDLFDALAGITNYTGNVTISDAPTVAQLKAINDATTGAITLSDANGALSGVAVDVASALFGITTHTGAVTITDAPSLAATFLSTINGNTSGLITASGVTTLTGSATEITAVTNAAADQISLPTLNNLILSDAVSATTFDSTVFTQNTITITLANVSGNVMTSVDATVNSTKILKIDGSTLAGTNALTFDGALETNGKFSVTGGAGADSIMGGSGVDTIAGGLGNDTINGGAGIDNINGGNGSDDIYGGVGNDNIYGGDDSTDDSATDTLHYYFNTNEGGDVVFGFNAGGSAGFVINQDRIYVHGADLTYDANKVVVTTPFGENTLVTFKSSGVNTGTTILLMGVAAANVTADDFVFGA